MVDAVVKIGDGSVVYAGPGSDAPEQGPSPRVECEGRAVLPGFVDSHTHLVFAGDRAGEFSMKMAGATYAEVAKSGGGILSTVAATRDAAEDDLFASAATRVRRMITAGTTTVEIKSGYGLDLETELTPSPGRKKDRNRAADNGQDHISGGPRPATGVSKRSGSLCRPPDRRDAARRLADSRLLRRLRRGGRLLGRRGETHLRRCQRARPAEPVFTPSN